MEQSQNKLRRCPIRGLHPDFFDQIMSYDRLCENQLEAQRFHEQMQRQMQLVDTKFGRSEANKHYHMQSRLHVNLNQTDDLKDICSVYNLYSQNPCANVLNSSLRSTKNNFFAVRVNSVSKYAKNRSLKSEKHGENERRSVLPSIIITSDRNSDMSDQAKSQSRPALALSIDPNHKREAGKLSQFARATENKFTDFPHEKNKITPKRQSSILGLMKEKTKLKLISGSFSSSFKRVT